MEQFVAYIWHSFYCSAMSVQCVFESEVVFIVVHCHIGNVCVCVVLFCHFRHFIVYTLAAITVTKWQF